MLPTKDPARWDVDKQRKHSETEARSPTRSSRARTEVKDDGTNQQKGSNKKGDSQDLVVLSSRESESRNSQRCDTLPLPGKHVSLVVILNFFEKSLLMYLLNCLSSSDALR